MYSREEVKVFLEKHCDFSKPETVYVLMGVARKKLNPNKKEKKVSKVIRRLDNIDHTLDDIEHQLKGYNYYIYVSVNPRSVVKAGADIIGRITNALATKQYEEIKKLEGTWISALMKQTGRLGRGRYLLDIDMHGLEVEDIEEILEKENINWHTIRRTVNGYHAIVEPFDVRKNLVIDERLQIEVKKDDLIFLTSHFEGDEK